MHALAGKRQERLPFLTVVTTFPTSDRLLQLAKAPVAFFFFLRSRISPTKMIWT